MWYHDDQLRKNLNLYLLLQANKNILCKNQIKIQNMYYQFKYEQLYIRRESSGKTVEILPTNNV